MRLLNVKIPTINTYNPKEPYVRQTPAETAAINLLRDFDFDIWYCLFSCENSFKLFRVTDLMPPGVIEKVRAGEALVVLDNALEPFMRSIDSIYQHLVIEEGIPERQIMLLTNMYDAREYANTVAKKLGKQPIRIMWFKLFEWDLHMAMKITYNEQPLNTLELKAYPKKFLNLNRRWRLHRPFLTMLLHHKGLIDKGYVSFGPCDGNDTWDKRWPEMIHYFRKDQRILDIMTQAETVKQLPPLYLDTDELHINRAVATQDTDQYYLNSYFSVVSETTYFTGEWYPNARFLSEKIFKAIAMKHPFILVSVPNSLEVLRIMGYKTFSPIIDESYDTELDDGQRMILIADEIERLSKLEGVELEKFLVAAKEIVDYNYNNLMSKTSFMQELI